MALSTDSPVRRLQVLTALLLTATLFVGFKVAEPYILGSRVQQTEQYLNTPPLDYSPWHRFAVQMDGRTKPFETGARETVRKITGRSTFQKADAVALMLAWIAGNGEKIGDLPDFETYPFILCEHHELRKWIFAHTVKRADGSPLTDAADITPDHLARVDEELTDELKFAKHIAPAQLRSSPGFRRLLDECNSARDADPEHGHQFFSPEQRNAEEVYRRLRIYDAVSGNKHAEKDRRGSNDPIHVVQLDRVPGSPWFSIGELKFFLNDPKRTTENWRDELLRRMSQVPQKYMKPEAYAELQAFQQRLEAKTATAEIDAINKEQYEQQLRSEFLPKLRAFRSENGLPPLDSAEEEEWVKQQLQILTDIRTRVVAAEQGRYNRDDPRFNMLHKNYLQLKNPMLNFESVSWQDFPKERAQSVVNAFEQVRQAIRYGSQEEFGKATEQFFSIVQSVSVDTFAEGVQQQGSPEARAAATEFLANPQRHADDARAAFRSKLEGDSLQGQIYPGTDTIPLELTFNRTQPFMYAWLLMVPAVCLFLASYLVPGRLLYTAAFSVFAASVAFQIFGFYARVKISGRPPVSNMYETVIFVAFMTCIFGGILEVIYRKRVIGLASSLVALIALVLADQLPLALDPEISPLVPVLRSNFWLIIHVLTIVASYAGGTLAWGLANVSLVLLVFGTPNRETLKTLSTYTYRAMQIAVLLLAAGTFLGGWWAAYSWGRFWGWDPKETWALISLVCYVIPMHMRYIGWVKDYGLAVSAIICFAAILMCWYGVNFVLGAGLHSYGFGGGGPYWVLLAGLLNLLWVSIASILYLRKLERTTNAVGTTKTPTPQEKEEPALVS